DAGQAIDPAGKNSIPLLFEWRKYSPGKYREVISLLRTLELASTIEARFGLEEVSKLEVQPYRHHEKPNIVDLGIGIAQTLAMLIADVALTRDGTLVVNQPEVHLHPSSQALLGNYLASRLRSRNYILETHSEYLINRLRVLAVQGKLNVDDVSILF